jgi:hypothetical protein
LEYRERVSKDSRCDSWTKSRTARESTEITLPKAH